MCTNNYILFPSAFFSEETCAFALENSCSGDLKRNKDFDNKGWQLIILRSDYKKKRSKFADFTKIGY